MSKHYSWTPEEIQDVRNRIRERAGYRCHFCNYKISKDNLAYTTHHIIPKRYCKEDCWNDDNLVCLCKTCHVKVEKFNNKLLRFLGLMPNKKLKSGEEK